MAKLQYKDAPLSPPLPMSDGKSDIETLRQDAKEHRQTLLDRLISFDMMYVNMVRETHFLLNETKTEWNIKLLNTQPTQVLSNLFTLVSNTEEIYLDDPRLLM